ncbi:MAG: DUF4186 family protein [Candidatus Helarchaeota archaeon]|nr:DUF4186 family protein [Candidatus Helarchaeota archaeon]
MGDEENLPDWQRTKPLGKLTCTSSKCEEGLHSFLRNFRGRKRTNEMSYRSEACTSCGVKIIDWERLDERDLNDVKYTIEALRKELFRRRYWARRIDKKLLEPLLEKELSEIEKKVENRIRKYVNKKFNDNPWDGRQTPLEGNLIYFAQHATASCCKKCIEEWHGINRNELLTEEQIKYLVGLIMVYFENRMQSPQAEGNRKITP